MCDTLYYNISIDNIAPQTAGLTHGNYANPLNPSIIANNSQPVLDSPDLWYGSIIRASIPCFSTPLIQFLVNTPVTNINQGIYSFTLGYQGFFGSQTYYDFVPQVENAIVPKTGTLLQDFSTQYYFLFSYGAWVNIMNTALASAFSSLADLVTLPIGSVAPYFYYEPATQLITLYAQKDFYDSSVSTPINIFFNSVSNQNFNGFSYIEKAIGSATGVDSQFIVKNIRNNNIQTILTVEYLLMSQEYVSLGYLSPLKNILITTNMPTNSEVFYINNPSATQNNDFINVLFDFVPDTSGSQDAGQGSRSFIYNAPSLYRVFEFTTKTPLYAVSLGISWSDQLGNVYPLLLQKGTIASFKIMFVKKSVFSKFLL